MLEAQTLGEALRLLLHRARLKQDALASELGVSSATVSAYLNDTSLPSAAILRRTSNLLSDRLNVRSDVLWNELGRLVESTATLIHLDAHARNLTREAAED